MAGVEGLVHISELAQHHVENPREVVSQGQEVKVLVLEIDGERRRLSLSLKRVEGQDLGGGAAPVAAENGDGGSDELHVPPALDLSEDVFSEAAAPSPPVGELVDPAAVPASEEAPSEDGV